MRPSPAKLGTPLSDTAVRVMLLGAGELGKEVAIELQRLGVEVIAVDRYPNAPAMQVAHRSHVIPMTDPHVLAGVIAAEMPHIIVPEIEAIATDVLAEIETAGHAVVIPTARAVQLTMNREGIRRLAAEELGLPAPRQHGLPLALGHAGGDGVSAGRFGRSDRRAAPRARRSRLEGRGVRMTGFGASAPAEVLYEKVGITTVAVVAAVKARL